MISPRNVALIAGQTFGEARRQKFFNLLSILTVGIVALAFLARDFNFGESELRFIADFGFGAVVLFGALLAIVATAQLFLSELDNRTAWTLLSKPVRRSELLLGKFGGLALILAIFVLVAMAALAAVLYAREQALLHNPEIELRAGDRVIYGDIFIFGLCQWVRLCVVVAFTLLVSTVARSLIYAIGTSFFVLLICQLQYIAKDAYAEAPLFPLGWIVALMAFAFPNFQVFNVGEQLVFLNENALNVADIASICGYGLIYVGAYLAISIYSLHEREM